MKKTNQDAVAEIEREEALRKRAARQALREEAHSLTLPDVTVRVTRLGADKISMGEHVGGTGEAHYEWKEEFSVRQDIALSLEERGYVEIQDAPAPETADA